MQFYAEQDIRWGALHLENRIYLQQTSDASILPLPNLIGRHALYFAGGLFKNALSAQIGVDFRYNTAWRARYYYPLTGQFILQDRETFSFYPQLDAFVSIRVQKFRAFLRFNNALDVLRDDFYYQSAYYALPVANIRWGISWRFVN